MGYYINNLADGTMLPAKGKVRAICNGIPGAIVIDEPAEWQEDLVWVVENSSYEAASYVWCREEMDVFKDPSKIEGLSFVWLIVPGAKELSGYGPR